MSVFLLSISLTAGSADAGSLPDLRLSAVSGCGMRPEAAVAAPRLPHSTAALQSGAAAAERLSDSATTKCLPHSTAALQSGSMMECRSSARVRSGESRDFFPTGEGERRTYAVTLDFGRAHLSGICVVKRLDGTLVGTLMNEFGIRAFDFRYDPHRGGVELSNLLAGLDRWYVRKTLRRDLTLLLEHAQRPMPFERRGRRIERRSDGGLSLRHLRRELNLGFTPLNP